MITLLIFLVSISLVLFFICLPFILKYKRIQVEVIQIDPGQDLSPEHNNLFNQEKELRRKAFNKVEMVKNESFFLDEDMTDSYYLTVVRDSKTNDTLLTSRHFFTKKVILESLKTDDSNALEWMNFNLKQFKEGDILLADRLAGNIEHPIFQKNRDLIFSLYYWKFIQQHPGKSLILFARSEPYEPLLAKYIRIGFKLVGCVTHNKTPHWVIITELSKSKKFIKSMSKRFLLLRILGWVKSM